MSGTLTMKFSPGFGEEDLIMCVDLDDETAKKVANIPKPMKHGSPLPWMPGEVALDSFEEVVEMIRRREYRKDLFIGEAKRLGERMEDAEGWHDESRVEAAKKQLRTGEPHQ